VPPDGPDRDFVDPCRSNDLAVAPRNNGPSRLAVSLVGVVAVGDPSSLDIPMVRFGKIGERLRLASIVFDHAAHHLTSATAALSDDVRSGMLGHELPGRRGHPEQECHMADAVPSDLYDELLNSVPEAMHHEHGEVFYSGRTAFDQPSPIYLLGYNPGGDPSNAALSRYTIGFDLAASRAPARRDWSGFEDDWSAFGPGAVAFQRRVRHLITTKTPERCQQAT
jgi:hypothetical protein